MKTNIIICYGLVSIKYLIINYSFFPLIPQIKNISKNENTCSVNNNRWSMCLI